MTAKVITGFSAAALMLALAAWFWLDDLRIKSLGVPVTGVYSGQYARHTANSKFGDEKTSAQLLLEIVTPEGAARRVRILDLTPFDALPAEGAEIELLWLSTQPDTARSAAALANPVSENVGWLAANGTFLVVATLADLIGRRRTAA